MPIKITVYAAENFNEETNEFIAGDSHEVIFEHSLASLSKWESIWEKPFLSGDDRTPEEMVSYMECMVINDSSPDLLYLLTQEDVNNISKYINAKSTATWFSDSGANRPSLEVITAELIYYWMNVAKIPIECENWHLNRLITLIRVHSAKNEPPKKKSRAQLAAERNALNEKRLAELGTTG